MVCPLCNDTGDQRYWEGRWRDTDAENAKLRSMLARVATQLYNPFEPDNQAPLYLDLMEALKE